MTGSCSLYLKKAHAILGSTTISYRGFGATELWTLISIMLLGTNCTVKLHRWLSALPLLFPLFQPIITSLLCGSAAASKLTATF